MCLTNHVHAAHTFGFVAPRAQAMPLNGEPATVVAYAMLLLAFGLMKSWSAPACNNPIFSMLVPPHCRNLVYAFDRWVLLKQRELNLPACNHRESLDASINIYTQG